MKKLKLIVPSFLAIIFCMLLIVGSTYAIFTSQSETSITIGSGKVNIDASLSINNLYVAEESNTEILPSNDLYAGTITSGLTTADYIYAEVPHNPEYETTTIGTKTYKVFTLDHEHTFGGANDDNNVLSLVNVAPGTRVDLTIAGSNQSTISAKYRLSIVATNNSSPDLLSQITVKFSSGTLFEEKFTGLNNYKTNWVEIAPGASFTNVNVSVSIPMTASFGAGSDCSYRFAIEAIQGNAKTDTLLETVNNTLNAASHNTVDEALTAAPAIASAFYAGSCLWNSVTDQFVLESDVPSCVAYQYFKAYTAMPSTQKYSIYATGAWTTNPTNLTVGFDAGSSTGITEISYIRTGENLTPREVIIKTNGGSLTINAPYDTVHHYGVANVVDLQAVASTSYVERGTITIAKIKTGRIVITPESSLTTLHVVETDGGYNGIKVALLGTVGLPTFTRDDVTLNNGDKKLVIEVQSIVDEQDVDATPEYVWISKEAGVTSMDVSSKEAEIESIPQSSQSAAVKEIVADTTTAKTAEEVEGMIGAASRYAGGNGTQNNPYLLATKAHFGSLDEDIHAGFTAGKYYQLTSDINLGEMLPLGWMTLSGQASSQGYTITGNEAFNGNLDGNNHSLTYEISIDNTYDKSTAGLFGSIQDSVISNIVLNASISSTKQGVWVGGIAGFGMSSNLNNVTVNGTIFGSQDVGGFFGYFGNNSHNSSNTFINCVNNAQVSNKCLRTSDNYSPTGGFVGQLSLELNVDYTLTFDNCTSNGNVAIVEGATAAQATISYFVGFLSDEAAKTANINIVFNGCTIGTNASISSVLSNIRTVGTKTFYVGASAEAIAAYDVIKYVGITSNMWGAKDSVNHVFVNNDVQDMSLHLVPAE